jgi:hypothetical protein
LCLGRVVAYRGLAQTCARQPSFQAVDQIAGVHLTGLT